MTRGIKRNDLWGGIGCAAALVAVSPILGGCFQTLNDAADTVPPVVSDNQVIVIQPDAASFPALPSPYDASAIEASASGQPCAYGSALCFELCSSPSCALVDNTIPGETVTAPIILPDGGTVSNACDEIEGESMAIRTRSCSACHGPTGPKVDYDFILDDQKLVTQSVGTIGQLIIPGDPARSEIYKRMLAGLAFTDPGLKGLSQGAATSYGMPPAPGGARQVAGSTAAQDAIVTPTAQDVSVMYEWILNCAPGAPDGGASQLPVSDTGDAGATAPDPDAGAHPPVDAGKG